MTKTQFKKICEQEKDNGSVLTALQCAQECYGYINEEAVEVVADCFNVSRCHVYGVATFYHQFTFTKKGKHNVQVCMGTACYVLGAGDILLAAEDELGIKAGETSKDGLFSIEHNTRCVGDCANAPIVIIGEKWLMRTNARQTMMELKKLKKAEGVV
jgi:NADH:ubiquinone oxidoreductase subunit E